MSQVPPDYDGDPSENGVGMSFAVILAGGFLCLTTLIILTGIFGPIIGFNLKDDPSLSTPTPQPRLYTANPPDAPRVNASSSLNASEVAQIERIIVAYVNAERADYNHRPLVRNPNLSDISRAHSYDMVQRGYYDHFDPNGHGPGYRAKVADYRCRSLAENIAHIGYQKREINVYGSGFRNFTTPREWAKAVVGRWMASGGHRHTILSPEYDVIGVGVHAPTDDQVFATLMVCDRRNWPDTPPEGMDAPVAEPGADYNESYWEPYPDSVNASWDDDPPSATPTPA